MHRLAGWGRNAEVDFRGKKRCNDTHESYTDPDCRLYRKSEGQQAKLCYLGHLMRENRNGLVVEGQVTPASGSAEREAAAERSRRCGEQAKRPWGGQGV